MPRRLPVGAEIVRDGVDFRVWASRRRHVEVVVEAGPGSPAVVSLDAEAGGWFRGTVPGAGAGSRYRFRVDGEGPFPDPASRWQPDGPHGASEVLDPAAFSWTDSGWRGAPMRGQVLYELHCGTFTRKGTWTAAAAELPALRDLGVTAVSLMPANAFPGRFGWGYDGVAWCAPTAQYGTPDDLRRFVDTAHHLGLCVLMDVVYNHFGPDGNYTGAFSDGWTTLRHRNDWGEALDFEGEPAVRDHVTANALIWLGEFHIDGLRLDATQDVHDRSPEHVLAEMVRVARRAFADRHLLFVAENEAQRSHIVRPPPATPAVDAVAPDDPTPPGWGLDALWNDDFHHAALVAATGQAEAYYSDYAGQPQELLSALRFGFLYQGQRYVWQALRRGDPALDLQPWQFVHFLQNHDQLANSARGRRLHLVAAPGTYRLLTALWLLGPQTPMFFQGQEFAAPSPFHYFADHAQPLAGQVARGRRQFMRQFTRLAQPGATRRLPLPHARATFEACQLDRAAALDAAPLHRQALALHRDLLQLRKNDEAFARQRRPEGAVLGPAAFVLRFTRDDGRDRLLVVNLGADLRLPIAPEPLLAPPAGTAWECLWSSEAVRYGGDGTPTLDDDDRGWWLPARAAVVLAPVPRKPASPKKPARRPVP